MVASSFPVVLLPAKPSAARLLLRLRHSRVARRRIARQLVGPRPFRLATFQASAPTLRIGRYLVGHDEDFLLAGHPDIRY